MEVRSIVWVGMSIYRGRECIVICQMAGIDKMKSNIDIICRIIQNTKTGSLIDLKNTLIMHGRNNRHIRRDIGTIVAVGAVTVSGDIWTYNPCNPIWVSISKRLDSADNQDS